MDPGELDGIGRAEVSGRHVDEVGQRLGVQQGAWIGFRRRVGDGPVGLGGLEAVAALLARDELLGVRDPLDVLLRKGREDLLRAVLGDDEAAEAERVALEDRAGALRDALEDVRGLEGHLRLAVVNDVVVLEGGLPRDARLGEDL